MLKLLRNQKGSIAVLFPAALGVILIFSALVIDVGNIYLNHLQLSNMVDASALAGAREFLPDASGSPAGVAQTYASLNGRKATDMLAVDVRSGSITVSAVRPVNLYFGWLFNLDSVDVSASATATSGAIRSARGVLPFGVEKAQFDTQQITYGASTILKQGGGSGDTGNYGALALGGDGAKVYEYNIVNGYNGTLRIGDKVSTETGNMTGPTDQGVDTRIAGTSAEFPPQDINSPRVITIPVLETMDVNGKKEVTIAGFANFFLEGTGGSGQDAWVKGRFMKIPNPGEITTNSGNYFGAYNVRLVLTPGS